MFSAMGNNMKYDPDIHHRRSIRLKGYDYSQPGLYFITICTQGRLRLYGEIIKGEMILNDAGIMVNKWWNELECKYKNIELHEQIIMPNHLHGIIKIINNPGGVVGADLRVYPNNVIDVMDSNNANNVNDTIDTYNANNINNMDNIGGMGKGEHIGSPLHETIQWFKTMSTNEYIRGVKQKKWQRFDKKLWQRNYYEHIIRDEKSYMKISEYIKTNPLKRKGGSYYE